MIRTSLGRQDVFRTTNNPERRSATATDSAGSAAYQQPNQVCDGRVGLYAGLRVELEQRVMIDGGCDQQH